jgi:hypothetical protein
MRVLTAVVCLGVLVAGGCAREEPRAAGVTERWLAAVGDEGRDNLRDKSVKRAEQYGEPGLEDKVVPDNAEKDERHFSDFEMGKAIERGATARVPFRLTARLEGGDTEEQAGTAVLHRAGKGWRVVAVEARAPGEQVPSDGGPRPSSAKAAHWLGAAVVGVVLAILSALIIERQPESTAGTGPA